MEPLLLTTKIQVPPQPHNVVYRARLIETLDSGIYHNKLIHISAPAGYGKTTLHVQWAHSSRHLIAWLSVSEADNDLQRFLRYLLAAWEKVQPGIMDRRPAVGSAYLPSPRHNGEESVNYWKTSLHRRLPE